MVNHTLSNQGMGLPHGGGTHHMSQPMRQPNPLTDDYATTNGVYPIQNQASFGQAHMPPLNLTPCNHNPSMVMSCRMTLATAKACLRRTLMEVDSLVLPSPMLTISEARVAFRARLTHTRGHLLWDVTPFSQKNKLADKYSGHSFRNTDPTFVSMHSLASNTSNIYSTR